MDCSKVLYFSVLILAGYWTHIVQLALPAMVVFSFVPPLKIHFILKNVLYSMNRFFGLLILNEGQMYVHTCSAHNILWGHGVENHFLL